MELYQLQTFITVIQEGSISGAARRLSITPSSVSTHIKALEVEFGVQLFVRTNHGVDVTDKGQILAQHARQTLHAANGLSQQASALQQHLVGTARIGMSVSSGVFATATFLQCVQSTYPDIQVDWIHAETASILSQLHQQTVDIGIIFGSVTHELLISHHLKTADLVLAMPATWQHPTDDMWGMLADTTWINTGADCPFQPIIDRLCQQRQIQPKQFIRTNDDRTRLELVCAGMGVSILEKTEATHPKIAIVDTAPMTCDVSLVYLAHRQFDPLIMAMRDLILPLR